VCAYPELAAVDRFSVNWKDKSREACHEDRLRIYITRYMRPDSKLHLHAYVIQTLPDRQDITTAVRNKGKSRGHSVLFAPTDMHTFCVFQVSTLHQTFYRLRFKPSYPWVRQPRAVRPARDVQQWKDHDSLLAARQIARCDDVSRESAFAQSDVPKLGTQSDQGDTCS